MLLRYYWSRIVPPRVTAILKRSRVKFKKAQILSLPAFNESAFRSLLTDELGLQEGDSVFIHSSIDQLNLGFPYRRILPLLQEVVGGRGTLLFPTYPRLGSYEFLCRDEVFDIRKTPSYTGVLTEIARRDSKAVRSLHPTKSVCAIGRHAKELVSTHACSPYPYDQCSPYYKIMEYGGKAIGIGVRTSRLAFIHCIEDALKQAFPVRVYHTHLFRARCINDKGEEQIIETYAHDMRKMNHNTPKFMKRYISQVLCKEFTSRGMNFFRADTKKLFDAMRELAKEGVTIYPKSSYSR